MTLSIADRGSTSSKAAGTTLNRQPTAAVAAGKTILVAAVVDAVEYPPEAPDEVEQLSQSPSTEITTVTDSQGNTYTRKFCQMGPGLQDYTPHIAYALFQGEIATALATSDSITVNFANGGHARAMGLAEVGVAAGKSLVGSLQQHDAFSGVNPIGRYDILPSLPYLLVGIAGVEGPNSDTITQDAQYTGINAPGTTGGADDTNCYLRWARRLATVTTDQWNPTLSASRKGVATLFAFKEV